MKDIVLIIVFFLGSKVLYPQGGFIQRLYLEGDNYVGAPVEYNGKYLLPVNQHLAEPGAFKGYLFVLSQNGLIEQKINISDSFYSVSPMLTHVRNGSAILLFSFVRPLADSTLFDLQITMIDKYFNIINDAIYDFNVNYYSYPYIIKNSENNILLSGWAFPSYSNAADAYILEIDENLYVIRNHWFNYYGVFNFDGSQIPNTNEFLFAFWGGVGLPRLGVLARTDSNFNIIRMDTIVDEMNLEYNLKFISDTTFILSGKKNPDNTPPRDDDVWLMILDTNNIMYHSAITGSMDTIDHPAVRNLAITTGGNILAGYTKNAYFYVGSYPSWFGLSCFDGSLNPLWVKYYGDGANWMLYFIMATNDGGCLLVGSYYDWNTQYNERDIVVVKVDSAGIITGVPSGQEVDVHDAIVYPNPGREKLVIENGPQIAGARFVLYDMAGKPVVEALLNKTSTSLSTTQLSQGLYLWNIIYKGKVIESGKWVKE